MSEGQDNALYSSFVKKARQLVKPTSINTTYYKQPGGKEGYDSRAPAPVVMRGSEGQAYAPPSFASVSKEGNALTPSTFKGPATTPEAQRVVVPKNVTKTDTPVYNQAALASVVKKLAADWLAAQPKTQPTPKPTAAPKPAAVAKPAVKPAAVAPAPKKPTFDASSLAPLQAITKVALNPTQPTAAPPPIYMNPENALAQYNITTPAATLASGQKPSTGTLAGGPRNELNKKQHRGF